MERQTIVRNSLIVMLAVILADLPAIGIISAQERLWQDRSGLYKVNASLVTSDEKLVVLKKANGELVLLQRVQLSPEDREYVAKHSDAPATKPNAISAVVDAAQAIESAQTPDAPTAPTTVVAEVTTRISTWRLRNGDEIQGQLIGFGVQTLNLQMFKGEILVNMVQLEKLPKAYELILPAVVSRINSRPIVTLQELEKHLAKGGGGPFEYVFNGIQLALDDGGSITVPVELLDDTEAQLVAPSLARWQASRGENVSEDDRYQTDSRERLILDSYSRLRGQELGPDRKMKLVELGLLGVNAGLTEVWEVELVPNTPYGYPRSVIVSGRDSATAQQAALQQYPGWQLGYVRKLSD